MYERSHEVLIWKTYSISSVDLALNFNYERVLSTTAACGLDLHPPPFQNIFGLVSIYYRLRNYLQPMLCNEIELKLHSNVSKNLHPHCIITLKGCPLLRAMERHDLEISVRI